MHSAIVCTHMLFFAFVFSVSSLSFLSIYLSFQLFVYLYIHTYTPYIHAYAEGALLQSDSKSSVGALLGLRSATVNITDSRAILKMDIRFHMAASINLGFFCGCPFYTSPTYYLKSKSGPLILGNPYLSPLLNSWYRIHFFGLLGISDRTSTWTIFKALTPLQK